VAPPPIKGEWDVRFGTSEAAKGWQELCAQLASTTREACEQMRANPRPQDATHYRLRGALATRQFGGRTLDQWQIKVSDSGRIMYLPDDEQATVWVVYASPAHSKITE
jgi:mRNA-degrading endonuclease RelE of RelBE toxin-antitoxin system